ncbi:MAG: hypothetical protein HRT72_01765 [Flavobacteriales bacterium]|nr:hypothetical protein [Flavobacteriales bacterium]
MKRTLSAIAIFLFIGSSFYGCKKGENDPFISLLSRDARITGTWILTKDETELITSGDEGFVVSYNFDGTTMVVKDPLEGNESYPFEHTLTISEGGEYKSFYKEDLDVTEMKGMWYWLNSDKNKTMIQFTSSWDDNIYVIDKLTNKELVLTWHDSGDYTGHWEDGSFNFKEVVSVTETYKKKE